jgi:hypothetical protein
MKKNSIIQTQIKYQTPCMVEIAFSSEGLLCQSQFGSGNEDYEPDPDMPGIDCYYGG